MKKTYIRPETQVVNIHTEGMIAASLGVYGDKTVNTSNAGEQLTNKKDPIWGTDEEEETGGFW